MSHQSPASTTNNNQLVSRKRRRGMIEKKRRDKINNSLGELRRLVPAAFEKQGSSKLEKAEILQMTVDYLRQLHANGLADILITKSKHLEQLAPSQPRPAPPNPQAVGARATAGGATTGGGGGAAAAAATTHSQAALSQQHQNASMVQASYTCQQHALANRVSPASSDQFGNNQADNGQIQSLDSASSYQHPRALYQYQAAAASTIYPGYHQEHHHLPSYYYG